MKSCVAESEGERTVLWPLLTTDSFPLSSTLSSAPTNTPAVEEEAFLEDTKRNDRATPPSVGTKGKKCQFTSKRYE